MRPGPEGGEEEGEAGEGPGGVQAVAEVSPG